MADIEKKEGKREELERVMRTATQRIRCPNWGHVLFIADNYAVLKRSDGIIEDLGSLHSETFKRAMAKLQEYDAFRGYSFS